MVTPTLPLSCRFGAFRAFPTTSTGSFSFTFLTLTSKSEAVEEEVVPCDGWWLVLWWLGGFMRCRFACFACLCLPIFVNNRGVYWRYWTRDKRVMTTIYISIPLLFLLLLLLLHRFSLQLSWRWGVRGQGEGKRKMIRGYIHLPLKVVDSWGGCLDVIDGHRFSNTEGQRNVVQSR